VRLALADLLVSLIRLAGAAIAAYAPEVVGLIEAAAGDAYHAVNEAACEAVIALGGGRRAGRAAGAGRRSAEGPGVAARLTRAPAAPLGWPRGWRGRLQRRWGGRAAGAGACSAVGVAPRLVRLHAAPLEWRRG
jgi:hypothetical protein